MILTEGNSKELFRMPKAVCFQSKVYSQDEVERTHFSEHIHNLYNPSGSATILVMAFLLNYLCVLL